MAEKRVFKLVHTQARRLAVEAVQTAPEGYCVTVSEPTRSLDQNAAMWPILQAFADQFEESANMIAALQTKNEVLEQSITDLKSLMSHGDDKGKDQPTNVVIGGKKIDLTKINLK